MPQQSRLNDSFVATCFCHSPQPIFVTGIIITASPIHYVDNLGQARLFDLGQASCGHIAMISSASPDSYTDNFGKARVGDSVTGCPVGIIVTGSPTTFTNG